MAVCSMPKLESFNKLSPNCFENLNSADDLSQKILSMHKVLQLTDAEFQERLRIVDDITKLLRPYYPDCSIIIFGSSANGFGFKGCDLDLLFLPFPEYCNLDFKDKGNNIIPSPYMVLNGYFSTKDLLSMEDTIHLKFVQRVMYRRKYYFKRITYIPAKCPILNIEFTRTAITCDFSASNRLVQYNTELLWIFGKLDHRVKPLVTLLRYWAKSLGFISKQLLSSYTFTLMVIFFLQNTSPAVLPSVKYLNELADFSRVIDGWETAINLYPECINATRYENTSSLEKLLVKFFDFYWQFDFIQNVVSPHLGAPLSVEEIKNSKDERIRTFQISPFSVQDPFLLSRNISRNASMKTSFKLALLIAKRLLLQKKFSFQLLFNPSYYEEEMSLLFVPTKNGLSTGSSCFSLGLTYELSQKFGTAASLNLWYERVCQAVLDVLQYGLLIECEVTDKIAWQNNKLDSEVFQRPAKRKKVSASTVGDLKHLMWIQCTVNFPTLWNRKNIQLTDNAENEIEEMELPQNLKKEYLISKELSKAIIKHSSDVITAEDELPIFCFMCQCFQYPCEEIPDIVVFFSPISCQKNFNEVKQALTNFVQKHVRRILEEISDN